MCVHVQSESSLPCGLKFGHLMGHCFPLFSFPECILFLFIFITSTAFCIIWVDTSRARQAQFTFLYQSLHTTTGLQCHVIRRVRIKLPCSGTNVMNDSRHGPMFYPNSLASHVKPPMCVCVCTCRDGRGEDTKNKIKKSCHVTKITSLTRAVVHPYKSDTVV